MEDKQKICDLLLPALRATRGLYDLEALEYNGHCEIIIAIFAGGYKKIANVAGDSGTAMIKDIIAQIT